MTKKKYSRIKFPIPGVLLLILINAFLSSNVEAESGKDILTKAIQAEGMVDFSGVSKSISFIKPYEISNEAKIFYSRSGMCRMEYMKGENPEIVVITKGPEIFRFDSSKGIVYRTRTQTSPQEEKKKKDLLFANYLSEIKGEEQIAGRRVYLIEINPKHSGRPSKTILVDRETYAILGSKLYAPDGTLRLMTYFTSVDFTKTVQPGIFSLPANAKIVDSGETGKPINSPEKFSKEAGFKIVVPAIMPEGFVLDGIYRYRCSCGVEMVHLRYFDGLAGISVFEGPKACPLCKEGFSVRSMMRGRMDGSGCSPRSCELLERKEENIRAFFTGNTRFILIGLISDDELKKIEDAICNKNM